MKKTLQDYILRVRKQTKLDIRFLNVIITDEVMDVIETFMKKYDLEEIKPAKKTIFHTNPFGFDEPCAGEVYLVKATVNMPVSTHELRMELARLLKVSMIYVSVMIEGSEPKPVSNGLETPEDYETKLSTDANYHKDEIGPDGKEFYGDEYNQNMIKTLDDARKEIKKEINKTSGKQDKE